MEKYANEGVFAEPCAGKAKTKGAEDEKTGEPRKDRGVLRFVLGALSIAIVAMLLLSGPSWSRVSANDGHDDDDEDENGSYSIGLWGDLPYSDLQAQVGVPNLIADMNAQRLAFTVHDGDLKAGNGTVGSMTPTTCVDAL